MKLHPGKRILAWVLSAALAAGLMVPVQAADPEPASLSFSKVDDHEVSVSLLQRPAERDPLPAVQPYAEHEAVRVSIVLEEDSTLEAGFSTADISENPVAMAYRDDLLTDQNDLVRQIEHTIRDKVDVVWNLTLAANIISANVEYGQIDAISRVPGVEKVVIEKTYKPLESVSGAELKPNMAISAGMTGAKEVWETGHYGAGTRIAIIDTGLDTDHQSFDPDGLKYAFEQNAEAAGKTYEEYTASLNLLEKAEIAEKLPQLNLHKLMPQITADDLYVNLKTPFGINYIDRNKTITHDYDGASEHGSHVAGISSGNRYLHKGESFVSAADTVFTQGNAPDSQIIVMKVFGAGSPTDADYMAALEDAIILGCDVVNLSLGSTNPGGTISREYESIMESLSKTDTVVAIAAGNEGPWSKHVCGPCPNLYVEDVSMQTSSEPATFTNSLAVASVENNGMVTTSLLYKNHRIGYTDGKSDYADKLQTLDKSGANGAGTQYDFVMLTTAGSATDYTGIDVKGKIAMVSRGDIHFSDKAKTAVEQGAIATLVYNNQVDNTIMNLENYWESAPCAMISKADAELIRTSAAEAKTEAGVVYYTGKITVDGKLSPISNNHDYDTMSDFSSWGVPGDLSMKPEISAPGGKIYSVNGAVPDIDQYEAMSGTSMAAPQVAGLSALVMERIRSEKLSQPGMTDRGLTQSLLMGTADPMRDADGRYISILQQGAGIANVRDAVDAKAYLTVAGQEDGKVKAELGDDPARGGSYTVAFTIHNLTGEAQRYELSADLFTQDTFEDYASNEAKAAADKTQMAVYMDYATRDLDSTVSWTADGRQVKQSARGLENCDFNGNGVVTALDAQALMNHVVLGEEIRNGQYADISGDGKVSTYDVHLFLSRLDEGTVSVPANGSVTVEATLSLTQDAKAYLDATYPNGAYIQAYIYASGMPSEEGAEGTQLNIPVLGFYGNWTDPSMFDLGTIQEKMSGQEVRNTYTGVGESADQGGEGIIPVSYNTLEVEYYRDPGYSYLLGGNPVDAREKPNPERTAINNQNGDQIYSYEISPIRNAASSRVQMTDRDGNVLFQRFPGPYSGAYYGNMMHLTMWINKGYQIPINFVPGDLAEGESFTASVTLAPEYNTDMAEEKADWDSLGHGATLSSTVHIDNTAPEILSVRLGEGERPSITVEARDNQYIAGVALYDRSGRTLLDNTGSIADAQPGDTDTFELNTRKANGSKFLIQVFDYAYNVSTYEVNHEIGTAASLPQLMAQDLDYAEYNPAYWVGFQMDSDYSALSTYAESGITFHAATIADPYIYTVSEDSVLYVLHKEDLTNPIRVGKLPHKLEDMAFNAQDGKIYGVYQTDGGTMLAVIDGPTGTLTDVGLLGIRTNTLAINAAGGFYANELNTSKVYQYTLETLTAAVQIAECMGEGDKPFEAKGLQSMEYDPNTGNVVWISYTFSPSNWGGVKDIAYLYEIKPDHTVIRHNDMLHHLVALIIPDTDAKNPEPELTDQAASLELNEETLFLMKSQEYQLIADVRPWTAADRSVEWESDNTGVVTVDGKGLLQAVGVGTATITARSHMNEALADTVTVHVNDVKVTMNGLAADKSGQSHTFSWNLENSNDWSAEAELATDFLAATAKNDTTFFITSGRGSTIKRVDLPGEPQTLSQWERPMSDLAYSPVFSGEKDLVHAVYMSYWLPAKDMSAAVPDGNAWNLGRVLKENNGGTEFVGIASGGAMKYTEAGGKQYDAEQLYLLDDKGGVLELYAYEMAKDDPNYDSRYPYNAGVAYYPSDLSTKGYTLTYYDDNPLNSLVAGNDGNLYLAGYNGQTCRLYQLVFNADTKMYEATLFADMGDGTWPTALTKVESNALSGTTAAAAASGVTLSDVADKVVWEEPAPAEEASAAEEIGTEEPAAVEISETLTMNNVHYGLMPAALDAGEAKNVRVDVTVSEASTNGLMTLRYDAARLELKSVESSAAVSAYKAEEGVVTFGYANSTAPIPAGGTVVTLTFLPKTGPASQLVVTTTERNDKALSEEVSIPVNPGFKAPAAPAITPNGQRFQDSVKVTLTAEADAVIHYTTDGTTPTTESSVYAGAFELTSTTTVKAIAVRNGMPSEIVSAMFTKQQPGGGGGAGGGGGGGGGTPIRPPEPVEPPVEPMYEGFVDVLPTDYYYESVKWAVEQGITKGLTETAFAPGLGCTRAQMVTFLWRAAGSPEPVATVLPFRDVEADSYSAKAILWAVEQGITAGVTPVEFRPNAVCTRAQTVTFMHRAAGKPAAGSVSFVDVPADAYYAEAVAWAAEKHITSGTTATTFTPDAPCTRGQIVTFLYRADQK